MVIKHMEETEMCQASTDFAPTKTESDDEFKWEEFFGTSVDITSTLLDMFDTIVAKNTTENAPQQRTAPPPCDPGGGLGNGQQDTPNKRFPPPPCISVTTTGGRPVRAYSKRSYSDTVFNEKKRPLSSSSVSSSSSSSSSSLPRNSLDVKKSYLASIESLDDDDDGDDEDPKGTSRGDRDSGVGGTGPPMGVPSNKPRWCDPNLSHTDRVILEIVDTEKTYVRDLNEIIEGYLMHINNSQESKIGGKYMQELFSNVEDIYKFNSLFVTELESCGLDPVAVARCFVKNSSGFEVYTQYCTNYPRTVSVLTELMGNTDTAEIFKERQVALQHSLPLGSFLLKPVQRILKYHLLLQNMVKHSDKESEGYCDVKNALSVMTGIAYHINDMKRKHEHAVRVQEIQSLLYGWEGQDLTTYGELVAEGAFRMYRAKALRHLFLFDKMLLIAKKKEEGILSYKTHIMCSNLMLIESISGEPLCFHVIPFDNPRYQYTFQARNGEQKREWCLQLKRVILENYNAVIPSHARQLVMELGQSKQEDSAIEKSTAKRPLSAPEYLEKRKQERRKSELNLNRTLKLKKTLKKGEHAVNKNSSFTSGRHKNNQSESQEQLNGHDKSQSWTKSQEDVCHKQRWLLGRLGNKENISNASSNSESNLPFTRGTRVRHSLPEPSLNQRHNNRDRRFRPSWRNWNSVPEETTDTENEDVDSKKLLDYCPPPRTFRDRTYSEASEEAFDNSGEYVTFFHAHAYATRDMPNGYPDFSTSYNQERGAQSDIEKSYESSYESEIKNCVADKTEHQKDQDSESGSSVSSWKQNSAIRRVQSFTGMAKARVQSLQHNISFKYSSHSETKGKSKKSSSNLPPSGPSLFPFAPKEPSPVAPAAWLKQQEEHLADGGKKSGSLPRSFQLTSDCSTNSNDITGENTCRMRMRLDGSRAVHSERPFTIASDKPSHADFGDDLDYVVLDYSQYTGTEYYFQPQNNSYEHDTTTGCTNTPAVSMENVHSIHPELKIYHQAASKYATLKHLFSHMGSKIAGLKATIVSPTSQDSELSRNQGTETTNKSGFKRSDSHTSIKSENELSPKMFTAKFAHSVAKAYSSVMRHKKKQEIKITDVPSLKKNEKVSLGTYKSESSLIGARMAQPLESEYSVPKYILSSKLLKDLRPDSLFSESSNVTSSSDGDKTGNPESCFHESQFSSKSDDNDDSISEASDTSADSYYERTFDEIENALAQDVFRDSAIYSDPEDADFSTVEKPRLLIISSEAEQTKVEDDSTFTYQNGDATSPTSPKIMCARKVNQAILDRLRILEENVKFQNEEASSIGNNTTSSKPYIQKRLDLDKWGNLVLNKEMEESETSSEHSASTVNTVMESGNKMNGNINNSKNPPRVKGWVKHVVDKLQGEGQV